MTDPTLTTMERLGIGIVPFRDEAGKLIGWQSHHPRAGWQCYAGTVKESVEMMKVIVEKDMRGEMGWVK